MKCKAVMTIYDDYGDNHATIRCQLEFGHEGHHQEEWSGYGSGDGLTVFATLTWFEKKLKT